MKRMFAVLVMFAWLAIPSSVFAQDKIAVLSVAEVIDKSREFQDLRKAWTAKDAELTNEENKLKGDLMTMQETRDKTLTPNTPEHNEMTLQMFKKQNDGAFKIQWERLSMANDQKRAVLSLYKKIRDSVEEVAGQEGYTIVINDFQPSITQQMAQEMNVNQFMSYVLQSSTIMYSNKDVNITQKIIDRIDATYSAEGSGSSNQ